MPKLDKVHLLMQLDDGRINGVTINVGTCEREVSVEDVTALIGVYYSRVVEVELLKNDFSQFKEMPDLKAVLDGKDQERQ